MKLELNELEIVLNGLESLNKQGQSLSNSMAILSVNNRFVEELKRLKELEGKNAKAAKSKNR